MRFCAISGLLLALLAMAMAPWCVMAASEERIAFQRNEPPAVTVMFADGTLAVDLAPSPEFTDPCVTPSLAPDGHTLAFAARVGDQFKLFTWRIDERNNTINTPQRLTSDDPNASEKFPSWSPDGKHIAFLSTDRKNFTTLRLVDADGTGLTTLAPASYYAMPMWRPDGQFLLYISLVNDKPVLHNISITGGKGLPIRPDSRIVAAGYSPDGKQIAVLLQRANGGLSDLYIIPPFGIGGRAVLTGIQNGKCLCWRRADRIFFNASKVGEQGGKAFWTVRPTGTGLQGITGYADPKEVAFFSVQRCDLTPYVPVAVIAPQAGMSTPSQPPTLDPADTPQDLTEQLIAHAVTIISPADKSTLQGKVTIKITAQKNVASVTLLIGDKPMFSAAAQDFADPIPKITYNWDTQEFNRLDPAAGLPMNYNDTLHFPDGTYHLCAQAFDEANRLLDQHTITVTVKNSLSPDVFPAKTVTLRYPYTAKSEDEFYRIQGEGALLNSQSTKAAGLNATLDAAFHRSVVKGLDGGAVGFRVEMRGPNDRDAVTYGQSHVNLPEFNAVGYYRFDPLGDISVAGTADERAYLPLAQLSLPFPNTAVAVGETWQKPMWVVTDLMDREATQVTATHKLDGFELIDGQRTIRIRSDYQVPLWMALHLAPNANIPNERGSIAQAQANLAMTRFSQDPGNALPLPGVPLPIPSIMARDIVGVRYSWFDPVTQQLVRVDDRILHAIPTSNMPPEVGGAKPPAYDDGTRVWYYVHYQYTLMPRTTKHP